MKFSLSWLKDHLDTDADIHAIAKAMTLAGLEVEDIIDPAAALSAFTVAKVLTAESHPDADKLRVCTVDTVDGVMQIVCGATNARADMTVAYAPMGAYIPGADFSLDKKPRKIRGVESSGMMCSSRELNLGDEHDGIMDLDGGLTLGLPIAQALGINDPVIDFEVTPNRPDWLGVDNIARDLAATGIGKWTTKVPAPINGSFPCPVAIEIDAPEACPIFAGRVVRGVINGPSPKWLQEKLKSIGLRPINALVDVTNYLSYDRARPLHVYDVDTLSGPIRARLGNGESFMALDDKDYRAEPSDCVIADDNGVLGLGGIMGGASTGCSEVTKDVFIESAYFDPLTIRKTAKRLGINSDAKYRFERGVDTGFVIGGLEMATQIILDICGGEASQMIVAGEAPALPAPISFDPSITQKLTGMDLPDSEAKRILTTLGFGVASSKTPWMITVPSHRRDCTIAADLVEEIARIAGYDKLPATSLPKLAGRRETMVTPLQNNLRLARRALAGQGLSEAISWSFCASDQAALFGGADNPDIILANPISADLDCMRPSALIHLLNSGQKSANQGYPGAALFEVGGVYTSDDPLTGQRTTIAGLRRSEVKRAYTGNTAPGALDAKSDALTALSAMGVNTDNLQIVRGASDYFHPGRSGRLQMGPKKILAEFGELHPRVLSAMGIDTPVMGFEIWPDEIPAPRKKSASKAKGALALSGLMPVHRDFAFIVPDAVAAGDILKAAKGADKALISDVSLFDIYTGQGVEDGHKSLAIDVTLTPKTATLTDKDIEAVSGKIITQVAKAGGALRQ